ncbi:galactosyl transferase GMA12/MNN10 family-domain-containing protein [Microdochium trichocladiopsis]|uniref:Galactosyl transferase GMA12/MNN10 family-domain-containing protein n=1 Tax=Microdochium trichocladiopsis TaxID=1682393 RepID=A0A9P8YDP9_9PEZI|nr:galactosyl transferase GMA12/MNN10 family-domain-containing protein [Microdochium trichocladiopsis]KAH7035066.1 galactosyl transferase GMA12/MNN10 family-domain-containing protein [Microdochium trichocladiopsis]
MSLSRSPSPIPGGGWSSPGLMSSSGRSSPAKQTFGGSNGNNVTWESARMKTQGVSNYPSFSTQNQGFFTRHMRRISSSLPSFHAPDDDKYADKEKLGRGRWAGPVLGTAARISSKAGRKTKIVAAIIGAFIVLHCLFYWTPLVHYWRRSPLLGGGEKFVIVLAANIGGGVMEWKGAREWAIERDSVRNKRKYSDNWGYDLEIVDMSTKKRYAHEWRESWEKVDSIRNAFAKYPKAEWVWWLDLNTYVMEPQRSLQKHIFDDLTKNIYRDINVYNPLNITHPPTDIFLDPDSLSPIGDGNPASINMILSQDCSGFNLGSFFMRRSEWTNRLLDIWWDPVLYEQMHMQWAHKEQDAFQQLYRSQPWIRKHTAFLPQRMINSFPQGACDTTAVPDLIHYNQKERDFLVNMAGCEWGRDCWGEMYNFRELSYYLNRNPWERFKEDLIAEIWYKITGHRVKL